MRIFKIPSILIFFCLLFSTGHTQTLEDLKIPEIKYRSCLDRGTHMLDCSRVYYKELNSLLNTTYKTVLEKVEVADRVTFTNNQQEWIKKRDIYFQKVDKEFDAERGKGNGGNDPKMIVIDNKSNFIKERIQELLKNKNEDAGIKQIETYLSNLEKVGFSGSVLVELNNQKVISKGYGFSDKEKLIKNSANTVFDIGSITKQFTAAAILKLEMQGKLSTNDKLSKFFENIPGDKENITIHDLLRHQAGLISNVGKDYEEISESEFLDKVFSSKLRFEIGTGFSYTNIGYSLLAMIIERVSGQNYEAYLYEHLWKPAQMEMTGYTRPEFDTDLIAVGYNRDNSVWGKPIDKKWDESAPYWHLKGNGGILSTTEDLYKWHISLMTDIVLSNEAIQKLYHPAIRPEETENSYYAYGWDVSQTGRKTTRVWHNGGNNILYADFLRFIDEGVTLIMLSNKSHPNFDNLNFEIARIIFDPDYSPEIPVADNDENRNFTYHIIKTIQESGLEKAKIEYQKKENSQSLLEFIMRGEGLNHLYNSKPDLAIQIFQMNVYVHPKAPKALQSLGEGYMETGNKELALKFFKESLSINPDNPFANDMIKKLKE